MASLKYCSACMRALPRPAALQAPHLTARLTAPTPYRAITSSSRYAFPEPSTVQAAKPPIEDLPPKPDAPGKEIKPKVPPKEQTASAGVRFAEKARARAPELTETYIAFGVTDVLYQKCGRRAHYEIPKLKDKNAEPARMEDGAFIGVGGGWWYEELKMTPTFNTWAQITMLHIYLLATRFRMFSPAHAPAWQQHLLDHFFYDAEHRMATTHNMTTKTSRNSYLKDLFLQYRGVMAAYDEGVCKGDAVLATAVWRNIFSAAEDVDLRALAHVTAYIRKITALLSKLSDEEVTTGDFDFPEPGTDAPLLAKRSKLADEPFREEDLKKEEERE